MRMATAISIPTEAAEATCHKGRLLSGPPPAPCSAR
jgi:hypothetical protein